MSSLHTGRVGLSIDAVGSNMSPVGSLLADIPVGATIRSATLYAPGTPFPWYLNSPTTLDAYNGAGITLGGLPVTNFSALVGANSGRVDIGRWYTARADVTALVETLVAGDPPAASHSWTYSEGGPLNSRIDGGMLVVVYEDASLPEGSVVLYDGGQETAGETTVVELAGPLDMSTPGFLAQLSVGISFSTGEDRQQTLIDVNGSRLTSAAGGFNDGISTDGALITAGGIGDSTANPLDPMDPNAADDELYDLSPFLQNGDLDFSITTQNLSNDDNVFFLGVHVTTAVVPEPGSCVLAAAGCVTLLGIGIRKRCRKA